MKKMFFKSKDKGVLSDTDETEYIEETDKIDKAKQQSFSFKNISENKTKEYQLPSLNLLEKKQTSKSSISKNQVLNL